MELTTTDMSTLFDQHSPALLRFFMRRTFDHQIALDLVGETYAVALENRKKFRGRTLQEARPWLFGIGNNLLNDYFRSGQIERRAMERLRIEAVVADEGDIARIDELAGIRDLRRAVAIAVTELPAEHRQALELRIVEQCNYPEIAEQLGVSEQTARARVSRALKKVRESLERESPETLGAEEQGNE
ncbi:MAG: RNA polymerase sigma factor [Solirubrobacterales bacterium]